MNKSVATNMDYLNQLDKLIENNNNIEKSIDGKINKIDAEYNNLIKELLEKKFNLNIKKCNKCSIFKQYNKFSKHSGTKDKLDNRCKDCVTKMKQNLKNNKNKKALTYPIYKLNMKLKDWQVGKPTGTILYRNLQNESERYEVRIPLGNGKTHSKSFTIYKFKSKEEAYNTANKYLYNKSTELGLTRNRIRIIDKTTIEVELTKNYIMNTDLKFNNIIQKYSLCATKSGRETAEYYANISINNKMHYFHKYITGFDMTDHIDRNPMNNCLSNLRETTPKLNNNNRSINKKLIKKQKSIIDPRIYNKMKYNFDKNVFMALDDNNNIVKTFEVEKYGGEKAIEMVIQYIKENNKFNDYTHEHIMGIRYVDKDSAFQARIKQNGKEYTKNFSVLKYGFNEARQMAVNARIELCKKFNSTND